MDRNGQKSRYLAGISLALMGAGFLSTIPFHDSIWGRLLQGGFEAGLVGGLADWFAVTALFRHPLGIPIPHTALLPHNRDRLTKALTRMLEEEWLTKESILGKMKQMKFMERILSIAENEMEKETFQDALRTIIREAVKTIDIDKLVPILEKELKEKLISADSKGLITKASQSIVQRQYDEKAFDYFLSEIGKWAAKEESKHALGKMGKQLIETTEADGMLKFALTSFGHLINEEKIGQMLQTFIQKRIKNVSRQDNRYRLMIQERIREEISGFPARENLMLEIEQWKNKAVQDLEVSHEIKNLLEQAKSRLLTAAEEETFIVQYVMPVLKRFIANLKENEDRMTMMEAWAHKQIAAAIEKNHSKIGRLVKENLDHYDTETLIDMMENNIGKDLQWIRVNGAVCGFFIGLVLTSFKLLF
ncbi:DUF445 domain-containing protein [Bacillus massilinigeriensis]|uniref:DUF445 domain-containing protein n=1 Tax=Bacillus mediterraneensis TaxID=1805474 RepID=UPI0008F8FC2F|nr:DUF445 domain-containing protein [Bacillus mediterraneensis]